MALGAGAGTRLRPLTHELPKVLCPVANRPLIDLAVDRLRAVTGSVAVNAHGPQTALIAHLDAGGVHVSVEADEALGTAGALGALRNWIDGRDVVVVNGDTWCPGGLEQLVDGWDGERIRILVAGGEAFGPRSQIAGAVMPWAEVQRIPASPSGLWEVSWRRALAGGGIETVAHDGLFVDCARPADYLRANLLATRFESSVAAAATVEGEVVESVVWPGAAVAPSERLWRAIRTPKRTVLIRTPIDP